MILPTGLSLGGVSHDWRILGAPRVQLNLRAYNSAVSKVLLLAAPASTFSDEFMMLHVAHHYKKCSKPWKWEFLTAMKMSDLVISWDRTNRMSNCWMLFDYEGTSDGLPKLQWKGWSCPPSVHHVFTTCPEGSAAKVIELLWRLHPREHWIIFIIFIIFYSKIFLLDSIRFFSIPNILNSKI